MSRWLEFLNWIAIFPYAYLAYFLGEFVGSSPKTPRAAALLFWVYLAVFPGAVLIFNLLARRSRRVGWLGRSALWGLAPWGVLAVLGWAFPAFVKFLAVF